MMTWDDIDSGATGAIPSFMDGATKREWATDGLPFFITRVEHETEGRYGDRWIVWVETIAGVKSRMTFGTDARRAAAFGRIIDRDTEGLRAIGALRLIAKPTSKPGVAYYTFANADPEIVARLTRAAKRKGHR